VVPSWRRALLPPPPTSLTVAAGALAPEQPQAYATFAVDDDLFAIRSERQKHHANATASDRAHGRLLLMEPLAAGDNSIVHVWSVR